MRDDNRDLQDGAWDMKLGFVYFAISMRRSLREASHQYLSPPPIDAALDPPDRIG